MSKLEHRTADPEQLIRAIHIFTHEVRTPLAALIAEFEQAMLKPELVSPDTQLPRWRALAEQTVGLIADLAMLSKPGAGDLRHECIQFSPIEVASQAIAAVHALHPDHPGIELLLGSLISERVVGDRRRINQALTNVLENALKYAGNLPVRLHLSSVTRPGSEPGSVEHFLELTVHDHGPGMQVDELQALFTPYYRGRLNDDQQRSGQGLGLPITRALLHGIGGRILMRSQPGEGTCVRLCIPVTPTTWLTAPPEPPRNPALAGSRILLAEDDAAVRAALVETLEHEGSDVTAVDNGIAAVRAASERAFDLILLDQRMPELEGVGAAHRIRTACGPCRIAPIILLTANQDDETPSIVAAAGINDRLDKPYRRAELIAMLQRWRSRQPEPDAPGEVSS